MPLIISRSLIQLQAINLPYTFQSLSGMGHSIEARDGDNVNATLLSNASQTDSGQAVKSAVTTGHVLWIRYRFSGSYASSIKMILTDSAGELQYLDANAPAHHYMPVYPVGTPYMVNDIVTLLGTTMIINIQYNHV